MYSIGWSMSMASPLWPFLTLCTNPGLEDPPSRQLGNPENATNPEPAQMYIQEQAASPGVRLRLVQAFQPTGAGRVPTRVSPPQASYMIWI